MKRMFVTLCMLVVIWLGYGFTSAVHQFIAQEALDYYNRITSDETYNVSNQNTARSGFITGSTNEDSFDIVYGYGQSNSPLVLISELAWPWNNIVSSIISEDPDISTTITHFWDSDNHVPYQTISHAEIYDDGEFSLGPVPTADTKANHIIHNSSEEPFYGYFSFRNPAPYLTFGLVDGSGDITVNARQFPDVQLNVFDMYEYKIISMDDFLVSHNLMIRTENYFYEYVHLTDDQFSAYIHDTIYNPEFNILGRLCHLLMDMCVPAHVHSDAHNPTIKMDGFYMADDLDNFEGWGDKGNISAGGYLSDDTDELAGIWEADNVVQAYGLSLIPIQQNQDDYYYLHNLFYTVNQITQFFASEDVDGNTQFSQIDHPYLFQMMAYLQGQQAIDPDFVAVTQSSGVSNNCEDSVLQRRFDKMRDVLIPLSIRATATLISWWGLRYGRHDDIAENVAISFSIDNIVGNASVIEAPVVTVRDHNDRSIVYGVYHIDNGGNYTINIPNPGLNNTINTDIIIETSGFHPIINYSVPISCNNSHAPISIDVGPYVLEPLTSLGIRVKRAGTYNTFLWLEDAINYALDNAFPIITLEPGEYVGPVSILIPDIPGMINQSLEIRGRYNDRSTVLKLVHLQYDHDRPRTLVSARSASGSACIGEIVFRDIEFRGAYSRFYPLRGIDIADGCAEEFKLINCVLKNFYMQPDIVIVTDGIALYSAVDTYIDRCKIYNNRGSEVYYMDQSRGVVCILANATITNSEISNNRSGKGAVYCNTDQGFYRFVNNKFLSNSAYLNQDCQDVGIAIQCHSANTIDISGNIFIDNGKFNSVYGAGTVIDIHPSANVKIASNTMVTTANSAFPGLHAIEICGSIVHVDNNIISKFDNGIAFAISPSNPDVLKNDLFWGNISDYSGIAYNTQANAGHCLFEDPHLSDTFTPLWNESIMSPCIDNGTGVFDSDGTPPDIGAYKATNHRYWQYRFRSGENDRSDTYHWVSYPVVNSLTQGKTVARSFFHELLGTHEIAPQVFTADVLQEIVWYESNQSRYIVWDGSGWGPYVDTHSVVSPQGYKVKLLSVDNSGLPPTTVELHHSGFLTPDNTPFMVYGSASNGVQTYENWIGYFDTDSVWPTDAFASIWNDITMIKAKDWCLYRDPNSGIGALIGKMLPINCGDMVIVTTVNDHEFQWNTTFPTDPKKKEVPTAFEYVEKADYTPVYIDLSAIDLSNLKEIGLKLDGICKGAVVVTDSLEQICAYLDDGESLSSGLVELVFFYESKSQPMEMKSVAINNTQLSSSVIGGDSAYPVYNIKVSNADLSNTVVPVLRLEQNYPNPFNPTTSIRYSIEEPGSVSLDIYNIKGQLVKTLYHGNAEIGSHTAIWNGLDNSGNACSSGVYFYRLRTPKTSLVRKMLMLK